VEIGPADLADLDALLQLLGELFAQEHDFAPDPEKQARGLRLILEDPTRGQLFVARMNGEVIAMASVLFTISTAEGGLVGLLEDVIVAQAHRSRGIGRRLLDHVLQGCAQRGLLRVTLLADHDNHSALGLYERVGFVRSGMSVLRWWPGTKPGSQGVP
jgi:ribosomal protein S18 acetylase RimI-like enzyme